ncbi:putative phage head-tail adaptor [Capnocytophaga cynodegmi]|uniref:Putative phage head-tail adaptor n=2 Tax=Capnocytophaga cynodegmi TaxID=28189 RepID=A0A0B7HTM0_9FLAO|nr:putative phage head-tail adaptor [Capnocytophaga cynodegmi]
MKMNNFEVKNFSPEVCKELKYYVYRLIDPRNGETFYVGKGKNNRVFEHLNCANELEKEDEDESDLKFKRIREIQKAGLNVIHIIHRHGLDSDTATQVEAALIDVFPNTTNIVKGQGSNEFGTMNAFEIITKYQAEIAELQHKVVMININRTITEKSVYDSVRFAWRMDGEKAKKAEYVLAMEKGIIVGVFKPIEWHRARKQYFPEFQNHTNKRWGFEGEEANEDIKKLYLRKRLPEQFQRKKGEANPIRYNYD